MSKYYYENRDKVLAQHREKYHNVDSGLQQKRKEYYEKNKDKILAQLKKKYHDEDAGLKERCQEYYDQNKEKILKQNAKKNRVLTYQEREKRRIYHRKYYYRRIKKSMGSPVNINEEKYIIEM